MKKSKDKDILPSPFTATSYKTERTAVALLMHWMREIIEQKGIPLGPPDVETSGTDRKMPDTVLYESPRSERVLMVLEAKPPRYDVFNYEELKKPAFQKANTRKAKYFATTNFKWLIWYNTEKANANAQEEQQIIGKYFLSDIDDINQIESLRYSESTKKGLELFLGQLYAVHTEKELEPKLPVDELLVFRLREKIRVLSIYYQDIIYDLSRKKPDFSKQLKKWFVNQGWSFTGSDEDFEKIAHQTAYLLINKILFYNALHSKRPRDLDPLVIYEGLTKGSLLRNQLEGYFREVLKIDYESIYTTDFIDSIAFPDSEAVVIEIRDMVNALSRYDFSTLGYDIIGKIFEGLIPENERHTLGQYFTNTDVVDLILMFCHTHEDQKVLDPSCGAGTFLVRAYQHKKLLNQRKRHEEILDTLWGNDIAKFPAHLATINLAINDLSVDKNYPNILHEDFFALTVGAEGFDLPAHYRKGAAANLGNDAREVTYPRWFDVIVGNPPYTRQEEIPEIGVDKENLISSALKVGNTKIAEIGKRAGIHAYFFVHGTKFLADGGRFGFIVSNSWLDVEYGKGLQEFFLKNYKLIAIIESKVERWFAEADINTCIVILEKCGDRTARDENLVRFVYLKKKLRAFIPPAANIWEKQVERFNEIDKLIKTILPKTDIYENEELRVYPKTQRELWEEGFDTEKRAYTGAKWGKYLRAPDIFFTVLKKAKGKLVPLKELASVKRGFTTGANEFFYIKEEEIARRKIEEEFWMYRDKSGGLVPNYVLKSPRECFSIIVDPSKFKNCVLMIHREKEEMKKMNILNYIKEGERKELHERPTCEARNRWYDLGDQIPPDGIWFKAFNDRFIAPLNKGNYYASDRFYAIYLRNKSNINRLFLYLNSTLSVMMTEVNGRVNLGEGALDNMTYEVAMMQVLDVQRYKIKNGRSFHSFLHRQIGTIFDELGATSPEAVTLETVKPDRRELDRIIMGDILGLTEDEQLEVYRAVIDLVKSRIARARSTEENNSIINGVNIGELKESIVGLIKRDE